MEFFTIGVYNSEEDKFFGKLKENGIDTFCDIRQRRGVRGAKYAFVNSHRLQTRLFQMNIEYQHMKSLAPPAEIRLLQKQTDSVEKKLKKERAHLSHAFVSAYKNQVLKYFDISMFVNNLEKAGAKKVVFFCVEEHPEACHRSLVAHEMERIGFKVNHL